MTEGEKFEAAWWAAYEIAHYVGREDEEEYVRALAERLAREADESGLWPWGLALQEAKNRIWGEVA